MSTPPTMSSTHFWMLTIGLLVVWTLVIAGAAAPPKETALATDNGKFNYKEARDTRNCKALCGHCGCLGFYCGEECICECNKKNDNSDTECIATMQSNARKLDIPYALLIQGPSSSRFVCKARQFEQNPDAKAQSSRNKRATVTIYKPAPALANQLLGQCSKKTAVKDERYKRSVPQLEWFNDFASSLVRPAPLGGHRKPAESNETGEEPTAQTKRTANEPLDRSWFSDNSNKLLRPSPLFKRKNSEDNNEGSYEAVPLKMVQDIPKVVKETIRNIQETASATDIGDVLRTKFRESADVFTDKLQQTGGEFELFPRNLRNNLEETLANLKLFPTDTVMQTAPPPPAPTVTESAKKLNLPWFRPVRFLQRVQEAIN